MFTSPSKNEMLLVFFLNILNMSTDTKTVKELEECTTDKAVMYKGTIYKVQDVACEGSLKRLKLVSLVTPRNITTVLWHPDSVVTCSPLITKRCLVIKFVKDSIFEVEGVDTNVKIDLGKAGSQALRWMVEGRCVCVTLFFCFEAVYIGAVYILPVYNILVL